MKLNYKKSSLVIVGGWNPHIISPQWIGDNFHSTEFLDIPDPDNPIKGRVDFQFGSNEINSLINIPISILFKGVNVKLHNTRMDFNINDDNTSFGILEKCALRFVDKSKNSEFSGYGINFVFEYDMIDEGILNYVRPSFLNQNTELIGQLIIESYNIQIRLDDFMPDIRMDIHNASKIDLYVNISFKVSKYDDIEKMIFEYPMDIIKNKLIKPLMDIYKVNIEV